jgi:hypothetical protein
MGPILYFDQLFWELLIVVRNPINNEFINYFWIIAPPRADIPGKGNSVARSGAYGDLFVEAYYGVAFFLILWDVSVIIFLRIVVAITFVRSFCITATGRRMAGISQTFIGIATNWRIVIEFAIFLVI